MFAFARAFQFPYLYFTIFAGIVLAICLFFWARRFALFWDQYRRKRNPPAPYDPRLFAWYKSAVWFWTFMVLFGTFLMFISFYLASYEYIGPKVGISGMVTRTGNQVEYVSGVGRNVRATVRGVRIAAAGVFVRFPRWSNWIGLRTYHRMATFRGDKETDFHYGKKPEASWLRAYIDDPVLLFLYKYRDSIRPALDVTYTESVYFDGARKRVIVTPQGYIIQ